MLTGKQTRHLRSLAHHLNPIFQVGKGGVNEHLIRHIQEALEVREQLAEGAQAELVQVIGKIVVLYKESRDQKKIVLPD
jgi:RNA-binding protein